MPIADDPAAAGGAKPAADDPAAAGGAKPAADDPAAAGGANHASTADASIRESINKDSADIEDADVRESIALLRKRRIQAVTDSLLMVNHAAEKGLDLKH